MARGFWFDQSCGVVIMQIKNTFCYSMGNHCLITNQIKKAICVQKDTTSLSPPVPSNCSPEDLRRVENFSAIPRETAVAQRYLILSLRSSPLCLVAP